MSKKNKKRNKPYQGPDAKNRAPTIQHYTAVVRSPLGEWWYEHKRAAILIAKFGGGGVIVIWLLLELLRLVFGW